MARTAEQRPGDATERRRRLRFAPGLSGAGRHEDPRHRCRATRAGRLTAAMLAAVLGALVAVPVQPAAPPAVTPTAAMEPDELPLRYGEHAGFSRLVFDWTRLVDYEVRQREGRARVSFDRPARVDLTEIEQNPTPHIRDLSARQSEEGLTVEFTVPVGARLRYFRSGTKVVIDVLPPDTEMAAGPPDASGEAEPAGAAHSADLPSPKRSPGFAQAGAAASTLRSGSAAAAEDGSAAKAGPEPPAKRSIPLIPDASPSPPSAPEGASLPTRVVAAEATDGRLDLTFDWPAGVAAAAFRRAGFVWVVFDRRARLGLNQARRAGSALVQRLEQVPTRAGTALRLAVSPGVNPSLRRKGDAGGWIVELSQQPLRPTEAIGIAAEPRPPDDPAGATKLRLALALDGAGKVVEIADREVGDTLFVIPVTAAGRGIDGNRTYVEFRLLGTAQGVVIEPRSDTLAIERDADGIGLVGADGLLISGQAPLGRPAGAAPALRQARSRRTGARLREQARARGRGGLSVLCRRPRVW